MKSISTCQPGYNSFEHYIQHAIFHIAGTPSASGDHPAAQSGLKVIPIRPNQDSIIDQHAFEQVSDHIIIRCTGRCDRVRQGVRCGKRYYISKHRYDLKAKNAVL